MTVKHKTQADCDSDPGANLEVALDLAKRGLSVFPITLKGHGDWTPITGWQAHATDDVATIKRWWREHPTARVGLPCGIANGISVLDIDEKNGKSGSATLKELGFPDVGSMSHSRVRSPSGGCHLFFKYEPRLRNSAGALGPGLDVRTEGGFVVAPGSYKDGKRYEPQGDALGTVELPPWPESLIPPPKPEYEPVAIVANASEQQRQWAACYLARLAGEVAATAEGQRHDTLNRAAFWAGGAGAHGFLTFDQAQEALLPAAMTAGLAEGEARRCIEGTWRDGLRRPICFFPDADFGDDDFDDFDGTDCDPAPSPLAHS